MTYNAHQLLHVVKGAEALGPLWAHSAFVFEDGNRRLLKNVTAAKGMPRQVIERVLMSQQLDSLLSLLPLSFEIKNMCQGMLGYEPLKNFEYLGGACMLGNPRHVTGFTSTEAAALRTRTGATAALEYFRFVQGGQLYHSNSYTNAGKSDSSVAVSKTGEFLRIERILRVAAEGEQKCYILCRKLVKSTTCALLFPSHINACFMSHVESSLVIEPADIAYPCLLIHFPSEEVSYACLLPNTVERD